MLLKKFKLSPNISSNQLKDNVKKGCGKMLVYFAASL